MNSKRGFWIVLGILVLGVGGLALMAIGRFVSTAITVANEPKPNQLYSPLLAIAKAELKKDGAWKVPKVNCDVDLYGVSQQDAWRSMTVTGMDVRFVERTFLPRLTDKAERLYSIRLDGTSSVGSRPPNFKPAQPIKELFVESGVRFWVSSSPPTLTNSKPSRVRTEEWQFVKAPQLESSLLDVPVFEPVPDYQVETFRGGKRIGTFAAWQGIDHPSVRFRLVGVAGERPPVELITTRVLLGRRAPEHV